MGKKKSQQIGRYRILGELGRGAMGIVYRAQDPALDRVVALKTIIMSEDAGGRSEYHKRFFQEAKAAGKLTHPHIVTTYDFGEEDGIAYLAMELLEGTELRKRMLEGDVEPDEALDIARQVADGLGFAHERGVVHRDIKPANIMLLPRGQVKIMDFGIARMRIADIKTSTGIVLGTPKYMSPEQIEGALVDHRSDIFSLGIVLYEMLTGARLFGGDDAPQIMHNVAHVEHEAPTRVNPALPAMLDFVVAKALKKNPSVRYQDTYELAADLATCLAELRGREVAPEQNGKKSAKDATRTIKLDVNDKAAAAPAARAITFDTRLPLSRQFDSSAALQRLTDPSPRDRDGLSRAPRAVGLLRRLRSDAAPRLFFIAAVAAAIAGGYIAFP
jgi:serine/threonine-protein kinase